MSKHEHIFYSLQFSLCLDGLFGSLLACIDPHNQIEKCDMFIVLLKDDLDYICEGLGVWWDTTWVYVVIQEDKKFVLMFDDSMKALSLQHNHMKNAIIHMTLNVILWPSVNFLIEKIN